MDHVASVPVGCADDSLGGDVSTRVWCWVELAEPRQEVMLGDPRFFLCLSRDSLVIPYHPDLQMVHMTSPKLFIGSGLH